MLSEKIDFLSDDGHKLSAYLDTPATGTPRAYALFAHCFTCSKDLRVIRSLSRAMNQKGFAVFRFDFTGLGESEGDFGASGFTSNVKDLLAASRFLSDNYEAPAILIGHSLGGAAVLGAAGELDHVKAVATIGAPAQASHVTHLFKESIDELKSNGHATVNIGGRSFEMTRSFLDDLERYESTDHIRDLRKPLAIFHSPQDQIVSIENAAKIYHAAHHPKSFISLDGVDHLVNGRKDAEYIGNTLAAWVSRYLPEAGEQKLESHLQSAARIDDRKGFITEVTAGGHPLLADEPKDAGGDDLGPTPYDLLAASLAACTAMTLKMYTQRKDWSLSEATVHVKHERVHHEDSTTGQHNKVDQFTREIRVEGDLDESQVSRLLQIANRCPVHRSLENKIEIETSMLGS